ncbi:MAG: GatB/YqeY domain-containing protein [Alphaproteobacteria bacterium]|nr:GatB/YqeY domain-containing protein [Rhodobiaceae bacterium]PDH50946.1 MAG: glutamyl-tRNA amidotransferase [alpha proteobacterium MED-G09]|tara:strand:+ start:240 stop:701 length:462 start_codon:yes stop_codon:yes gene_type:complete
MLLDLIKEDLKIAMKAKDTLTVSTLRMVTSAIKNIEINNRISDGSSPVNESQIIQLISKMIKQRKESADIFRTSDRLDLEKKENEEIKIIQKYMPVQIDDNNKINSILDVAIEETGSAQIRDMGKVMAFLKDNYSGQMDFGKVSVMLKDKLKS